MSFKERLSELLKSGKPVKQAFALALEKDKEEKEQPKKKKKKK